MQGNTGASGARGFPPCAFFECPTFAFNQIDPRDKECLSAPRADNPPAHGAREGRGIQWDRCGSTTVIQRRCAAQKLASLQAGLERSRSGHSLHRPHTVWTGIEDNEKGKPLCTRRFYTLNRQLGCLLLEGDLTMEAASGRTRGRFEEFALV